jgi:hypothetical protein
MDGSVVECSNGDNTRERSSSKSAMMDILWYIDAM